MANIIDEYIDGSVRGWPGLEVAEAEFPLVVGTANFVPATLQLLPTQERKSVNYKVIRKFLGGKDMVNIAQEIGDCVSWGGRNAAGTTGVIDIVVRGDNETWKDPFPPYYYGTSRVQIGGGRLGNEDGSLGSWLAAAVMKYGTIYTGDANVPPYSGRVAKDWGRTGPPREMLEIGPQFLIKSAVKITTWDELVTHVVNGYGVSIASDVGFQMEPNRNGFHPRSGTWHHQMAIVDVDDTYSEPYAIIRNSWGDVHGVLKDFYDNETLPKGCLRAYRRDVEAILRQGESFAYTQYEQPKTQDIPAALFRMW